MAWSQAAREAAAAARKQAAHQREVNQLGQWKHYDANGRSLQAGDRVQDTHYGNAMGTVTRTYFEGGDPQKQPLLSVKLDSGGGGTTVTRQPGAVTRYISPEEHEYNRELGLRLRNR